MRNNRAVDVGYDYIVKLPGSKNYLHLDPINGHTWTGRKLAYVFDSAPMAATIASMYCRSGAFELVPVEREKQEV